MSMVCSRTVFRVALSCGDICSIYAENRISSEYISLDTRSTLCEHILLKPT
jgi:hypothetical protein